MLLTLEKRGRHWAVLEGEMLVCLCVYKKGALEVLRRLTSLHGAQPAQRGLP